MWSLKSEHLKRLLREEDQIRWNLRLWRQSIPFEVDEIQLSMFRHGVGFLTLSARPIETSVREGSLATWLNFIYGFRYLRGKPYATTGALKDEINENGEVRGRTSPEGIPPDLPPSWAEGGDVFRKLICPLLLTGAIKEPIWWDEVFVPGQLIPYVALFVDRKPKNGPIPEAELYDLLYRLRNVAADRQHISMSNSDRTFDHPDLLPFADNMWFYFSLGGGGFLAYNAPSSGPYRTSMPKRYLKDEYFLAFLLTLQQRFVLGTITDKIAEHWLPGGNPEPIADSGWSARLKRASMVEDTRSAQFDDLLEDFLMFSARGHFVQLMQGEHHQLYYQKWREKFKINDLFEEVQNELEAMHNYLQMVVQERVNFILHVLTALSIILGIVGTLAGWWALNLDNITTTFGKWGWPSWLVWFTFILIVPLIALGIAFFMRMGWFAPRRRKP
ncbi:MAG: CorA family divalent cation transporter [Chloroflexia bacterium]